MRLDLYLSEKYGMTRSRAKLLIEDGAVSVDGKKTEKPSFNIEDGREYKIDINDEILPYVSRGGLKLQGALDDFKIELNGRICADIGASTGGFTDCMLRRGAVRVYALDSGTNQLADVLKNNGAVTSIENFNARNLTPETFGELCDFAAADLSFISQTYVMSQIYSVLKDGGEYIGLIKPQFECGREAIGKGGIVKSTREHKKAIDRVFKSASECGFDINGITVSPIKGGDGNREFLFLAEKHGEDRKGRINVDSERIKELLGK